MCHNMDGKMLSEDGDQRKNKALPTAIIMVQVCITNVVCHR